jgi:hypothetical protein
MCGKQFVVLIITILILLGCCGCGEKSELSEQSVQTQQSTQYTELKQAPGYTKIIQHDEYDGFVYRGMLRKDLRDSGFGWSLQEIAKVFEIPVQEMEKPEEYKDFVVPYELKIGNDEDAITLRLDTSHKEGLKYLNSFEGANASYKVMQSGNEVNMESPPFTHHGGAINIQPLEFLKMLHIGYSQKGQTFYIGQEVKSHIDGKVFFDDKVMLGNDKVADVKLLYKYDPVSKPNYDKVELTVNGQSIVLFDHDHPGSSDYYQNGYIEGITYHEDSLLEVNLDEDVVILKRTDNGWERIFSPDQYKSFGQGKLSLQIANDGAGTFVDSIHRLESKVSVIGGIPNTVYPINFMYFGHLESDELQNQLVIKANLSAWESRSIFNMEIRFEYDGTNFTPISMASWDNSKYGAEKGAGKEIKSMDEYLQFSYNL